MVRFMGLCIVVMLIVFSESNYGLAFPAKMERAKIIHSKMEYAKAGYQTQEIFEIKCLEGLEKGQGKKGKGWREWFEEIKQEVEDKESP